MKQARLHLPPALGLSCSDDGRLLAGIGHRVVVVDLATQRRLSSSLPFSHPVHTSFSPDGSKLAVKSTSGRIAIIDPSSGKITHDFANDGDGEGCSVRFSPDGHKLVDGSWGGDLIVRGVEGHSSKHLSYPDALIQDVVHDVSRNVWLVLHQPRALCNTEELLPSYVSIWHWPFSRTPVRTINPNAVIDAICLSPDGKLMGFVEGYEDRRVHIARVEDGQTVASSGPIGWRHLEVKLAWSRDGRFIAATIREGRLLETDVVLLDANDLSILVKFPCSPFAQDLLFLPHSRSLAFGGVDNRIKVMQLDDLFRGGGAGVSN